MSKNPLFGGHPGGDVTVEGPDGVTKTEGHCAPNSLLNSGYAHGGPDACGWGAFRRDEDGYGLMPIGPSTDRFRVG